MPKFTKNDEFKISLSTEDINKIDEEIKKLESNSKKTFDDLSMIENHKSELTKEKENSKVIDGVVLLNTCMACHNKFKPVNSMIYETSCNVCSEKKQIS
jgi:septal ring factor EnvC (AmiA/AmiB activator)